MSLVFNLIYLILLLAQMFIQRCSKNLENYKKRIIKHVLSYSPASIPVKPLIHVVVTLFSKGINARYSGYICVLNNMILLYKQNHLQMII